MILKWMVGVLVVSISFAAFGKDDASKAPAVKATTDPVEFKAQSETLQKQMEAGGRYEFVKPDEHERINADLQKIQGLLERQAAGSTLSREDIAAQLTAQNEINAIFAKRDGDRLVCERTTPIGSHLPQTTCVTFSEKQHQNQLSSDFMRDQQKRSPPPKVH
ncbi:hypothetical protein ELE36_17065 [Pseudolysobacter antarcticus]|uniref:Uncharacterized protein n=1 Tax=Pseudolysobacter antarcticus TaxID=2511995 RepID=A0A411HN71_9GAMM|nr:hypothetical protein ELE36_17065 [Pseudolysobacter antarcticus]